VNRLARFLADDIGQRGLRVTNETRIGAPDAPASVTFEVDARTGDVSDLVGTHCLRRQSPHRGQHSRKRWYVDVSVIDAVAEAVEPAVDAADVTFTACRARGPGGQHVNKSSTAIMATHAPSGISVRAESERSQRANRKAALLRIGAHLARRAQSKHTHAKSIQRSRHDQVTRGQPVRVWTADDLSV
jgi:protein subunit release factor B